MDENTLKIHQINYNIFNILYNIENNNLKKYLQPIEKDTYILTECAKNNNIWKKLNIKINKINNKNYITIPNWKLESCSCNRNPLLCSIKDENNNILGTFCFI